MFRLSKITDYGILLLAHLAGNELDERHNARELAGEVELPLPVVSKILKSLARRGLLQSHRGSKGGYSLSRPASHISVAEMIEALEGPVALTECSRHASACIHEGNCPVRDPWQVINRVVQDALADVYLADLVDPRFPATRPLEQLIQFSGSLSRSGDGKPPTQ